MMFKNKSSKLESREGTLQIDTRLNPIIDIMKLKNG